MSLSETRAFLEDLLSRFDPDIDLTDGSRAQQSIITPVLNRIGIDPFDSDIATFITQRVRQSFPDIDITEVDALQDVLISPMRVLIESVVREVTLVKLRSSIQNVESLSDQEVDALMANFFKSRQGGGFALGVVRAYFANPVSQSATIANPASTGGGLRFFPTVPQAIMAEEMLLNQDGSEYYFDINYQAERPGDEYNIEPGQIVSIANFPTASRIVNLQRFRRGVVREGSLDFVARAQESTADSTLTTTRGLVGEITNNFPEVQQIAVVGYRDPEMMRDIIRGGGMGAVLDDDDFGTAYNNDGTTVDDVDGDTTTQIFESLTGSFVNRVASVGSDPGDFFISITYVDPVSTDFVYTDFQILAVLSDTRVRVDGELPPGLSSLPWALRKRQLTLSDIPGGITLPDTVDGQLLIEDNAIHIGGKTDVYIAGVIDEESSQISSLTDEDPLFRGFTAQTQGLTASFEDIIILGDISAEAFAALEVGFALVLEEGVDADVYVIRQKIGSNQVRVPMNMTGQQSNLSYRVVDEIDQELTDPKDIKVTGDDLVVAADSATVTTTGATNFIDANVQIGDVLEITDDLTGGDYEITSVGAVTLDVDPAPLRSASGLRYRIFRRSEAVQTPIVRITGVELLDSTSAPTGTAIPYRDPVLAASRSFQNEASGFKFDGLVVAGLVGGVGVATGGTYTISFGSNTLELFWYDPEAIYAGSVGNTPFALTTGARTAADIVTEINADLSIAAAGIRATVITYQGFDYIGIAGPLALRVAAFGTVNATLGFSTDADYPSTSSNIRAITPGSLLGARVMAGDLIEFINANNTGGVRVLRGPDDATPALERDVAIVGDGPFGPNGTEALYDNRILVPEIGARVRIGRPSVGSARTYFLAPTSAEFIGGDTLFTATVNNNTLVYRPDPDLQRTLLPAPPLTELPKTGTTSPGAVSIDFEDTSVDFLAQQVRPGDVIAVRYRPIVGTAGLPASPFPFTIANDTLIVRIGDDNPFITITFPNNNFTRDDVVDFINEQVGQDIASISGTGELVLVADDTITIDPTSTVLANTSPHDFELSGASTTNIHPEAGEYIIRFVIDANTLQLADLTTFTGTEITNTAYEIRRYVQRISSTEMNENTDETQLYYADVELISTAPGDRYNIPQDVPMEVSGHRSDGYRLVAANPILTYSRAEVLHAQFSRSILLPGSSDSPEEVVQLSRQNVQVNYGRSQTVDDVQSFVDSELQRVVTEEILVRHLFPHFANINWAYAGGGSEPDIVRAIETLLGQTEPDSELEVGDFTALLRSRGAVSVYSPDPNSQTGRTNPIIVVIHHTEDRKVSAVVVADYVNTGTRLQRFLPGSILVNRTTGNAL